MFFKRGKRQPVLCVPSHFSCVISSQSLLSNSLDYSPPGSFVHGIFQARYWGRLLFPPLKDLPNPGIKLMSPASLALQADLLSAEPSGKTSVRWPVTKS